MNGFPPEFTLTKVGAGMTSPYFHDKFFSAFSLGGPRIGGGSFIAFLGGQKVEVEGGEVF